MVKTQINLILRQVFYGAAVSLFSVFLQIGFEKQKEKTLDIGQGGAASASRIYENYGGDDDLADDDVDMTTMIMMIMMTTTMIMMTIAGKAGLLSKVGAASALGQSNAPDHPPPYPPTTNFQQPTSENSKYL